MLLNYRGEVAEKDTRLLTSAFCAGLLEGVMEEEVNIVNADVLIRELGIELTEEKQSQGRRLQFLDRRTDPRRTETDRRRHAVRQQHAALIRLNDYRLEAYLDGNLFVFKHMDVPGSSALWGRSSASTASTSPRCPSAAPRTSRAARRSAC
jgi:D-3-phosphoglycerate dehydrogenase / 2-oxoglutarate reductase